jgi:hypothetical protein
MENATSQNPIPPNQPAFKGDSMEPQNAHKPAESYTAPPPPKKSRNFKSKWPYLVIAVLLVLLVPLGGYFVLDQTKKAEPTPPPVPTKPSEQIACTMEAKLCPDGVTYVSRQGPKCEFTQCPTGMENQTSSYQEFLEKVNNYLKTNDPIALINLQKLDEIECDPYADYIFTICEGAKKGEIKKGYWLGRNQSEGSILPSTEYNNFIKDYLSENGPFNVNSNKQKNNSAIIVYRGKPIENMYKNTMFAVYATNKSGIWQIVETVYGPLTEDFESISDELFNFEDQ